MTTLLNVKDLRAYYGQVQALHGLSFSLNEGSLTTLLPSGVSQTASAMRTKRDATRYLFMSKTAGRSRCW